MLHRRLAAHLDEETLARWTPRVLRNIEEMSSCLKGEPHTVNLGRWRRAVSERDLVELRRLLTGSDEDSVQMREVSPFRGLLPQAERREVLRSRWVPGRDG